MEFAEPFESMSDARAAAVLSETWGISAESLSRLDTERDDSFRVTANGADYLLKVAHPADDPLTVNLQTAALSFAAEHSSLPLQQLLLTSEGEIEPLVDGRVARLLTWLPGHPVAGELPPYLLGESLGWLSDALSTFDHPAAHRDFVWDLGRLDLVRDLQPRFGGPEVAEIFARWDALDLSALPRQVIHNDFHAGNLLTDGERLTGVLDFGDVVHTVRVIDLAVALCYLGYDQELIDGFTSVVPLRDDELAVLPTLVAARFAQRILLNQLLGRGRQAANEAALRDHLERMS